MLNLQITPEVLCCFSIDLIDGCIETAKRNHNPHNDADFHYCHTPEGTLCILIHAARTGLPMQVSTEAQGRDMAARLNNIILSKF